MVSVKVVTVMRSAGHAEQHVDRYHICCCAVHCEEGYAQSGSLSKVFP